MFEAIGRFLDKIFVGCLTAIIGIIFLCIGIGVLISCPILIIILLLLAILCKVSKE